MPERVAEYIRSFLAAEMGIAPEQIKSYKFAAERAGGYSEYTQWDFNCDVHLTLTNGDTKLWTLDEGDVVRFLNGFPEVSP